MQPAYAAWGQQASAAGSFQRFAFNSAPTQAGGSLSSSSTPSTDISSSESIASTPNYRPGFQQQSTPSRALLGNRPARPGLGYGARPASGAIRFDLGRRRGSGVVQNRFSSEAKSAGAGLGFSESNERAGGEGSDQSGDKESRQGGMPDSMK